MKRLLTLVQTQIPALILTTLAGFAGGILTIYQAWLLSRGINAVFLGGATIHEVANTLTSLLILITLQGVVIWISEVSAKAVAVEVKINLRRKLFNHILRLGPAYTRGERSGSLTTTVMDGVEALDAYFSQYLPQLVLSTLVPLGILIIIVPIDILSGLIFFLTAPLIPVFMILIGKAAESLTNRQYESLSRLSAHFLDSLQGLKTLKLFGRSKVHTKTIESASNQFRDRTLSVLRVTFLSALVLEILSTLSTAIIAVQIGLRLLHFQIGFEEALFILIIAPSFYLPLRMLGLRFHAGMAGTTAARKIFEILDIQPNTQDTLNNPSPLPWKTGPPPLIQLKNVTYTYPDEKTPTVRNISLAIYPGEHIALVGPSGSGKSTIVQLMLGFIQPQQGEILVNGKPFQQVDLGKWRESIAWVPQNPYLFHDTIAANLSLGVPGCTNKELEDAAQKAYLDTFINELPQKYQTVIMESGARLSSGQAQRLALARAFLKKAPLLILDEPTSNLDPTTEYELKESFQRLIDLGNKPEGDSKTGPSKRIPRNPAKQGRSIFTIAHRLNTVSQADRILVLKDGKLRESGTHFELLREGGFYAEMFSAPRAAAEIIGSVTPSSTQEIYQPLSPHIPTGLTSETHIKWHVYPNIVELKNGKSGTYSTIKRMLAFLRGSWRNVFISVLLGTATIASNIGLMGTSAWLISSAALHPSIAVLQVAVVGVRAFGIGRGIFRYLERLATHQVTFRLLAQLRKWFYDSLEPLVPARLMQFHSGDLLNQVVSDIEILENFYVRVVSPPLIAIIISICTLFFFWNYNPDLVWSLTIPILLIGIWLPFRTLKSSREVGEKLIHTQAVLRRKIVDGIQGLPELLAFQRAKYWEIEVERIGSDLGNLQKQLASNSGFNNGVSLFLGNLGALSVLATAIPLVNDGTLDGVMLAVFVLIALAFSEALSPLPLAAEVLSNCLEAAQGIFAVVNTSAAVQDPPNPLQRPHKASQIIIRDLSFHYQPDHAPALMGISFSLQKGKKIAVVGPSGAGKSTLVQILLRFWEYDSGFIQLNGKELHQYHQEDVRACLSVIPSDPYFFNTTIRENLRLAKPDASSKRIQAASKAARIHDVIQSLPQGYNTVIGEWGTRLSSGQRQRLSIARALIRGTPILITDEPTANLDPVTEREILDVLIYLSTDRALLHITHRLVKLDLFDEIIVLDSGRIVERGQHEDLLKMRGLYWKMWRVQEGEFLDERTDAALRG